MADKNEKPNIRLVERKGKKVTFRYENCRAKLYSLANFARKHGATLILEDNQLSFVFKTEEYAKEVERQWNMES